MGVRHSFRKCLSMYKMSSFYLRGEPNPTAEVSRENVEQRELSENERQRERETKLKRA